MPEIETDRTAIENEAIEAERARLEAERERELAGDLDDDDDTEDEDIDLEPETGESATAPEEDDEREVDSVLDISTDISPPKLMLIDGEEYQLLNYSHLSPDDESVVTALFARFQRTYFRLEAASSDQAAAKESKKLAKYRRRIILKMTNIPPAVVTRLKARGQGRVLGAIQEELGMTDEDVEDVDDDGDLDL